MTNFTILARQLQQDRRNVQRVAITIARTVAAAAAATVQRISPDRISHVVYAVTEGEAAIVARVDGANPTVNGSAGVLEGSRIKGAGVAEAGGDLRRGIRPLQRVTLT